ncbi:alpha-1A adrenergic receptor-like [Dreissena polymorpha]|uniref:alpha-1A adrenergic receptor-like n=1 Tax=Dreissena polymorpha TaxID=45954 RepID=UPI002264646D|nr:alpha-1A adrenergic receptor-like [Dreissena polymorpha]
MIVIMIITTVGNVCLWVVVLRSRALRTLTSMFILGLSTADILVGVVNMPITVYTIIKGRWEFSHSACVVFGFLNMITLVTSVLSLCNISINRYVMVCYPQMFKHIYTVKNAVSMVIGVVIFSILLSLPPLIGWSEYVYTPSHSFCFADWQNHMSYAFFMIGCCFGIPFTVMSVCNVFILRTVSASRLRVKTSSEPQQSPASIKTSINRLTIGINSEQLPTEHTRVTFKSLSLHMSRIERKIKIEPLVTDINKVPNNNSTHSKSELQNDFHFFANTISVIDIESLPSSTLSTEPLKTSSTVSSTKVRMTSKIVHTKVGHSTTTLHTPSSQSMKSSLTRQQRSRFLHPDWKPASENTPPGRGSPVTAISLDPSSDVSFVQPLNSETEFNAQGPVYDKQMSKPKGQETPPLKRREEILLLLLWYL